MKKSYAKRYVDRIMNDGESRTSHQIVDSIMTYIEDSETKSSFAYVPQRNKVSSYLALNKKYVKVDEKSPVTYRKLICCETCDGCGYIKNNPCEECNKEEQIKSNDCVACSGSGYAIEMPCSECKGLGRIEDEGLRDL